MSFCFFLCLPSSIGLPFGFSMFAGDAWLWPLLLTRFTGVSAPTDGIEHSGQESRR
jgi:hypothetical protein